MIQLGAICTDYPIANAERRQEGKNIYRPFNEWIGRALPSTRVGSFACTKHSIVSAFLSTWMYTFHKACTSDKSSTWTELDACMPARARSRVSLIGLHIYKKEQKQLLDVRWFDNWNNALMDFERSRKWQSHIIFLIWNSIYEYWKEVLS